MKNKESKNKNGFSLLELLVVILIIGILAAIALPQYQLAVFKARFAALMDITNKIYESEERYYMIWDKYTENLSALDMTLEGCELSLDKSYCTYDWGVCEVLINGLYDKVSCLNRTSLKNGYSRYLSTHNKGTKKACFNLDTDYANINSKYNKICKEFGGELYSLDTSCVLKTVSLPCSAWYL